MILNIRLANGIDYPVNVDETLEMTTFVYPEPEIGE